MPARHARCYTPIVLIKIALISLICSLAAQAQTAPSPGLAALGGFLDRFDGWVSGRQKPGPKDWGLSFEPTGDNLLELFVDHEPYHRALFRDLNEAKHSIHVQMFGIVNDAYGREWARTLARKAREGVKVRLLADKFGARLIFWHKEPDEPGVEPTEKLLDGLRAAGVEVTLYDDPGLKGTLHFDHRKFYVIDGQIGWNTGYTIESAMRERTMDQGTRAHGGLVHQLQATFLVNWLHSKGRFPEAAADPAGFRRDYFPEPAMTGKSRVRLADNVPHTQWPITESYYERIRNARSTVLVSNLYFADEGFAKALLQARANGAEVSIITEAHPGFIYQSFARHWFHRFRKAGINAYYFKGREGYGKSHAKVVYVDGWVSTGSCNFDRMSLAHNGEQNIETDDPAYAEAIRLEFFEESLRHSVPFTPTKGVLKRAVNSVGSRIARWVEWLL